MKIFIRFFILLFVFSLVFLAKTNIIVLAQSNNSITELISELDTVDSKSASAAKLQEEIGMAYYKENQIDNAIKYLGNAESIYTNLDLLDEANSVIINILSISIELKRYTVIIRYSLTYIDNATTLYKETGNEQYLKNMVGINYLIATTCNILGDKAYGKEYFNVGESLESKYDVKETSSIDYVKSNYYYYQEDYTSSEKYAYKGIILAKDEKSKFNYLNGLIYLARVQLHMNDIMHAKANLAIVGEGKDTVKSNLIDVEYYYYLGSLYSIEKEWNKAIDSYLKAYKYMNEKNNYEINIHILNKLGLSYSKIGDYKNAVKYYQEYIKKEKDMADSKEQVNASIIINIHKNDPQNILSEIKIKKSQSNIKLLLITTIAAIFLLLIIIKAYYSKKKNMKKLSKELNKDNLTKAYNRRYTNIYMKKLAKNYEDFFVVMVDVDNYKSVNDTYGHQFGDLVLKKLVKTMRALGGANVLTCRYGGEEFLLVIKTSDSDIAVKISELIRLGIHGLEWDYGNEITVSMGVAKHTTFDTIEEVIEKADSNLYKAKRSGKNKVIY